MGRTVDLDDVIDTAGVAEVLGLARNSVAEYRSRYDDFPEPAKILGGGRCLVWVKGDVEAWGRAHPRRQPVLERQPPPG